MIFTTEAGWEIKDPMLRALGQDKSVRNYSVIEIQGNVPLFHVDIRFYCDEDKESLDWRRFIMWKIEDVKQLVKQEWIIEYDVYLETPRKLNNRFSTERHSVKKLSKIICGKNKYGCEELVYFFVDGTHYISIGGEVDKIINPTVVFDDNEFKFEKEKE